MPTLNRKADGTEYRVVVFGSAAVGKTSIVTRFLSDSFKDHYTPTVEDTHRQVINSDSAVSTLHITDTGGSHSFPAMVKLAIQRGHAFILVYAVNNRQSFNSLRYYYNEILLLKKSLDSTPLIVVGNKCDMSHREIIKSEGENLAKQWQCSYVETSAKNQLRTTELFEQLLHLEKGQLLSLGGKTSKSKRKKIKSSPKKSPRKTTENDKGKCNLM